MCEPRKCFECNSELNMNFYGRYHCPKCDSTYWESDFVENERGLAMKTIKGSITVEQAVKWLNDNGVINSADYWLLMAKNIKWLDKLLINVVTKFSEA